ncbi:hypothetical protein FPCIR_6784 [Fusarium pseudocircinatum]|uniref:Uncharacterized protein n=1 Tax=Fusarium pseudocircinatum TaxID=56676 RepID=A0A8H5P425_9HYPO|nr:hypothetical protein FPCIR_6784 [Fusarium pseudocircinatum]
MAPASTFEAEDEPGPHSPAESVSSTVSADGEAAIRNVGRKSLAREIEDCLERENRNRNEDTQPVVEFSIEHAVSNWFLGCQIEDLPSEPSIGEIWEIKKRVYAEKHNRDAPEMTLATTVVAMIICSLLILAIAHYTY